MERVARIELASSAWKAEVLPLNYTRQSFFSLSVILTALKPHFQSSLFLPALATNTVITTASYFNQINAAYLAAKLQAHHK